jgi:putative pyruvate formate lyase activating enzyme
MVLACATRHFGEEPSLTGVLNNENISDETGGSGTLFFSGCTLRCGFCQNRQLSRSEVGLEITQGEFVEICLKLQQTGAENINLVSATPFIPSLEAGIAAARRSGLRIPIVWNTSGYELPEMVERLAGFVDIFLPDLKLLDSRLSGRLFSAKDYPEVAREAILRMVKLRPVITPHTVSQSGTIVRHLVLPGLLSETWKVLEWFSREVRDRALLSLMVQFAVPEGGRAAELEDRPLTDSEYARLLEWLDELHIEEGYIQEPGDEKMWWPDFTRHNPFPRDYSKVVWSWTDGFSDQ